MLGGVAVVVVLRLLVIDEVLAAAEVLLAVALLRLTVEDELILSTISKCKMRANHIRRELYIYIDFTWYVCLTNRTSQKSGIREKKCS